MTTQIKENKPAKDTNPKRREIGRRKTAVAVALLEPGKGKITVNGRPMEDYFTVESYRISAQRPLVMTQNHKNYDVVLRAIGGGLSGQADAASLAIARALIRLHPDLRPVLKKEGLLRRDPRMRERKKPGQPGARRRFQFSKR